MQQRLQQLRQFTPAAQRFAAQLLGCAVSAADACQSSLERALTTAHYPTDPAAVKSWFFQVVRHQCLDQLRRNQRTPLASTEQISDADQQSPCAFNPDHVLQQQQMAAVIQRAMTQLPLAHAEILWLREVQEFSYQQIAQIVGIEAGTVMSRIHRARLALRAQLVKMIALEDL